ncbi:MAG: DUF3515 family protein [Allobranchiibius sp.]
MHRRRLSRLLPLAVAAAFGLSGCSGSPAVQAKIAPRASSALCAKVATKWPKLVAKQQPRDTTAKSDTVRAWGDPAIVARCGVTSPGPTTDPCVNVDGVDWVGRPLSDGFAFVTFGRSPAIEVLIPTKYGAFDLAAFGPAVKVLPRGSSRCTAPSAQPNPTVQG